MTPQQRRLINDNPNLSHAVLGRFIGLTTKQVFAYRVKNKLIPLWFHKGVGLPFAAQFVVDSSTIAWRIECKSRAVFTSSNFSKVIENIDRILFCLERNNGRLPPTLSEWSLKDLEFNHEKRKCE